ncbi:MAG: hypothetical protein ACXWNK_07890, partial [Vulcanimicrobiaceae bacterium]
MRRTTSFAEPAAAISLTTSFHPGKVCASGMGGVENLGRYCSGLFIKECKVELAAFLIRKKLHRGEHLIDVPLSIIHSFHLLLNTQNGKKR